MEREKIECSENKMVLEGEIDPVLKVESMYIGFHQIVFEVAGHVGKIIMKRN